MSDAESLQDESPVKLSDPVRWIAGGLFFGLLAVGFYILLRPFVLPVSWAFIAVTGAWPVHSRLLKRLSKWPALAAFLSSVLMVLVVLALLIPLMLGLGPELSSVGQKVASYIRDNRSFLVEKTSSIPVVGPLLVEKASELQMEPGDIGPLLMEYSGSLLGSAGVAAQGLIWLIFNISFFFMAVFFLFYYGQTLLKQLQIALDKMDTKTEQFTLLVQRTVTGVLYGLVFTSIAQGFLAGVGFAIVGVRSPVLLGMATAFLSVVPVGPPLLYLPVAANLFFTGSPGRGIVLALWGVVLVSSADNILKPYFISKQANVPFPMAILGVTGGVLGFGVIGVFVGPVIVGLVLALWKVWLGPIEEEEVAELDEVMEGESESLEDCNAEVSEAV